MDKQAAARAKAHVKEMVENASAFTEALGLPPEKMFTVLSVMYKDTIPATALATQPTTSTGEEAIEDRIFQLSNDFLSKRMKGQVATFRAAWEKLKTLPLETLGQLGQTPAASQGLGFAGGSQQLLPVVSTISWAVISWPSLSQTNAPEKIITQIAEEAWARGCSEAVGYALAKYLQTHLRDS